MGACGRSASKAGDGDERERETTGRAVYYEFASCVQIRSQYLLLDCVSKLHSLQQFLHHTCVPCHHINIHIQPRYTHFKAFTTLYNSWFSRSHECSETREALRSYSNAHVLPCTFRITNTTHIISHTRVKCLDKKPHRRMVPNKC